MWNSEITYENQGENGVRITCTSLKLVEHMVERLKKDFKDVPSEEVMLPFEFIIGTLFPTAYNNIKEVMTHQYIEGYNAASLVSYEEVESDAT